MYQEGASRLTYEKPKAMTYKLMIELPPSLKDLINYISSIVVGAISVSTQQGRCLFAYIYYCEHRFTLRLTTYVIMSFFNSQLACLGTINLSK